MNIVKLISDKLSFSITKTGTSSLLVSGGTSLLNTFEELSKIDICWSKVQVTIIDDRLVDSKNINSNQKLIKDKLLINNAKKANFYPLTEDLIKKNIFKLPFDITLMGMGEDGHFASLFPEMINDYKSLNAKADYKIFKTKRLGNPAIPRITMNLSLILNSRIIILLVKGKIKQEILSKAIHDDSYPIHYLLNNRNDNFFVKKID
tara:strand:- start:121 stop:735 length:615 start_codon:yes stop_codon:yes gene_type:complete